MRYRRPEILIVGDAEQLIENSTIKPGHFHENLGSKGITPAYDLDE